MRPTAGAAIVLAVLAACPATAAAAGLAVLPASGTGISSDIIGWTRGLLVAKLNSSQPRLRIVDIDRPPTAEPPSIQAVMQMAAAAEVDETLQLHMTRSGGSTTLSVTVHDRRTGLARARAQEVTGGGPEVLPEITARLAARIMDPRAGDPAVASTAVCPPPKPTPMFAGALHFGFRLGAAVPFAAASGETRALPAASLFLISDRKIVLTDLTLDFGKNDEGDRLAAFGLGVYFPFTEDDPAPYLGAAARWTSIRFGGQGASGITVAPAVGINWKVLESSHVRVEASYFFNLFVEKGIDRLVPGGGGEHRTHGLALGVGLWF